MPSLSITSSTLPILRVFGIFGAVAAFFERRLISCGLAVFIACQIESVKGVEHIEEISAVDGVDMIFIGRNDLAADCGHILELDHPEVVAMLRGVATVAQKAGKKIGTVPSAGLGWAQLFKDGFDMVLPSGDISLLRDACLAEVRSFRESFGGSRNHPPQKVVSVPDPPPKSSAITRADA